MNLRVVDGNGSTLIQGRNLQEIRLKLGEETDRRLAEIDESGCRRDGLVTWDFEELPEEIIVDRGGMRLTAFPMLVDQGNAVHRHDSVALRLSGCRERALCETRRALGRLFVLDAYGHIMPHVDWLPGLERMRLHAASMGPFDLRQELCELIADRAFLADQSPVRTRAEFEDRRSAGRERIGLAVQDVASVVDPLLEAYHEARLALERAETGRLALRDG